MVAAIHRWQSLSAVSRYRPCREVWKTIDGHAAPLRQLHISRKLLSNTDEDRNTRTNRPPRTRIQRSKDASTQIASLKRTSEAGNLNDRYTNVPSSKSPEQKSASTRKDADNGVASYDDGEEEVGDREEAHLEEYFASIERGEDYDKEDLQEYEEALGHNISPEDIVDQDDTNFANENERQHYAGILALMQRIESQMRIAQDKRDEGEAHGIPRLVQEADKMEKYVDRDIEYALKGLETAVDAVAPRHRAGVVSEVAFKGLLGGVPVGQGSMGHVVEDALRYLTQREDNTFKAPGKLGQRLIDGEFVKYTSLFERSEVALRVGNLRTKDQEKKQYKFKQLSKQQRRAIVKTIVEGRYEDSKDATIQNPVLQNAARITGFNSTYGATGKSTVLDTIQSLLPSQQNTTQSNRQ